MKKIREQLLEDETLELSSVAELLTKLGMTYPDYLKAVRTSLSRETFLYKRLPSQIWINAFPKHLSPIWGANMDIQVVLNAYSAAMYIASYMMKGQRGMSNLLQRIVQDPRDEKCDLRQCIRHVGNAFMNAQEISIQEAVSHLLGLRARSFSRKVVWVSTDQDRTRMLKKRELLERLDDDDPDIYADGLLEHVNNIKAIWAMLQ